MPVEKQKRITGNRLNNILHEQSNPFNLYGENRNHNQPNVGSKF